MLMIGLKLQNPLVLVVFLVVFSVLTATLQASVNLRSTYTACEGGYLLFPSLSFYHQTFTLRQTPSLLSSHVEEFPFLRS